jgi:hypothetical protein
MIFLPFPIALAQLPALPVKQRACKPVPPFATIELGQHAPPVGRIVEIAQHVQCFSNLA